MMLQLRAIGIDGEVHQFGVDKIHFTDDNGGILYFESDLYEPIAVRAATVQAVSNSDAVVESAESEVSNE